MPTVDKTVAEDIKFARGEFKVRKLKNYYLKPTYLTYTTLKVDISEHNYLF